MPEDTSSSRTGPRVFSSTELSNGPWDEYSIETNLPYRDVLVNDLKLGHFQRILADREWVVGLAWASVTVRGFCVYILKPFRRGADFTHQQTVGDVRIAVCRLG